MAYVDMYIASADAAPMLQQARCIYGPFPCMRWFHHCMRAALIMRAAGEKPPLYCLPVLLQPRTPLTGFVVIIVLTPLLPRRLLHAAWPQPED